MTDLRLFIIGLLYVTVTVAKEIQQQRYELLEDLPDDISNILTEDDSKYFLGGAPEPQAEDIKCILYCSAGDEGKMIIPGDGSISGSSFNSKGKTVVLIHGWEPNDKGDKWWVKQMKEMFFTKGGINNVIVVDWRKANHKSYDASARNSRFVGTVTGELFQALTKEKGMDRNKLHVVGFDIGAHIAGIAGFFYPNIGHITGLDPAGPYFQDLDVDSRLDCDDALFVDSVHTDTGGFGYNGDCGDVDIYPNGGKKQPGAAEPSGFLALSLNLGGDEAIGGSHFRAVELYKESIGRSPAAYAYMAESYEKFMQGNSFTDDKRFAFGPTMDQKARGFMYMITQSQAPFLSNNYVQATAMTSSSRITGVTTLKIRGLKSGKTQSQEMIPTGGILNVFKGEVRTVVNLPEGRMIKDLGWSMGYKNNFLGGDSYSISSVTLMGKSKDNSKTYGHCDAFTITNICPSGECTFPLQLKEGSC